MVMFRSYVFYFLLLLVIAACPALWAQPVDSLERVLTQKLTVTERIETLNELSFAYFDTNVQKADSTSNEALRLSRENNDRQNEGWSLVYRGMYFFLSADLPQARSYFNQAHEIAEEIKDANLKTYSLTQIGNVLRDRGRFDSCIYYYRLAEKASKLATNKRYAATVYANKARYYLTVSQPDSALVEASIGLKLRAQLGDSVLLADSWIIIGNCYRAKGDLNEARIWYQKCEPLTSRNPSLFTEYLQNMGDVYFRKGDYKRAMENWMRVISLQRSLQYKYTLAELLLRMGTVFEQQALYQLATDYLGDALKIAENGSFEFLRATVLHELSWVYFRTKLFDMAIANSKKAENVFQESKLMLEQAGCWDLQALAHRDLENFDSSLYFHQKSLTARRAIGNMVDISASVFNIGEYYLVKKDYNKAIPYYRESLTIDKKIGDSYGLSLINNRLGKIYTQLLRFDSAKLFFDQSIRLAKVTSSNEIFKDNYLELAEFYKKTNKPEQAMLYFQRYAQLNDSIYSNQTAQSLASYRTLYDVERNEQQMALLNKDFQLTSAQMQRQRAILYSAIALLIMLLALAVFYYRFSKKQKELNASLLEKNQEIEQQTQKLLDANQSLNVLNREIAEQKEELQLQTEELAESNQMIARINESLEQKIEMRTSELKQAYKELDTFFYRSSHDFRRPITTFLGLAEVAKITLKDGNALDLFNKVAETATNLDRLLLKLQGISELGMHQMAFKEILVRELIDQALSFLQPEIEARNIKCTLKVTSSGVSFYSYPPLIKLVIENLIENAVYFSAKDNPSMSIEAQIKEDGLSLVVADNGQGILPDYQAQIFEMYFRANENSKGNGLGLYIVKKIIARLNGAISFESEYGTGSTFAIFIPNEEPA